MFHGILIDTVWFLALYLVGMMSEKIVFSLRKLKLMKNLVFTKGWGNKRRDQRQLNK